MTPAYSNCSCDPISPTIDCNEDQCTPFFTTFFSLHILVLIFLATFFLTVEYRSTQKSALWRIILGCGIVAELAKVIRTGLLIEQSNRHSMDAVIFTLYNTHMCFGSVSFVTLLFFWARLQHDLVPGKRGIFGKLNPIYITIVVILFVFYYLQVVFSSIVNSPAMGDVCTFTTGAVFFILSVSYIVNGLFLWKQFLQASDRDNIFFKMFLSAFISSIILLTTVLCLFAFNVVSDFNTTRAFFIKHSIYETLFILLFLCFPSGFVVHYFQTCIFNTPGEDFSSCPSSELRRNASVTATLSQSVNTSMSQV